MAKNHKKFIIFNLTFPLHPTEEASLGKRQLRSPKVEGFRLKLMLARPSKIKAKKDGVSEILYYMDQIRYPPQINHSHTPNKATN